MKLADQPASRAVLTVTDLSGKVIPTQKFNKSGQPVHVIRFKTRPVPGIYLVIVNGCYAEKLAVY